MSAIIYTLVRHDGGWPYEANVPIRNDSGPQKRGVFTQTCDLVQLIVDKFATPSTNQRSSGSQRNAHLR